MNFLIGHVFQGKEREKKKNIIGVELPIEPPHAPSHLEEDTLIFLTPSWMGSFHNLNTLHAPLEACRVA
jgi:hypothetical protein